ncbi:MAG: hypothetical protein RBG13Loki_1515 [Promethearchaeota archaeon CR_4]|nr:MAG: hypothetical protein RBG13Loki_1515 [Candidatus Lokiarchaeota archaeon CR_4]
MQFISKEMRIMEPAMRMLTLLVILRKEKKTTDKRPLTMEISKWQLGKRLNKPKPLT